MAKCVFAPPRPSPASPAHPETRTVLRFVQFFVTTMAMMLFPFVLVLGWVVLCSRPIQCRVWMPSLFWVMNKVPYVGNVRQAFVVLLIVTFVAAKVYAFLFVQIAGYR